MRGGDRFAVRAGAAVRLFGAITGLILATALTAQAQQAGFQRTGDALVLGGNALAAADMAPLQQLQSGQKLQLGPESVLMLGYFESCIVEQITGGSLTIGIARSSVEGGMVERRLMDCRYFTESVPQLTIVAEYALANVTSDSGQSSRPWNLHFKTVNGETWLGGLCRPGTQDSFEVQFQGGRILSLNTEYPLKGEVSRDSINGKIGASIVFYAKREGGGYVGNFEHRFGKGCGGTVEIVQVQ